MLPVASCMVPGTADPAWGAPGAPGGAGLEGRPQGTLVSSRHLCTELWEVLWEGPAGESWGRCREMWGSLTCVAQGGLSWSQKASGLNLGSDRHSRLSFVGVGVPPPGVPP